MLKRTENKFRATSNYKNFLKLFKQMHFLVLVGTEDAWVVYLTNSNNF